MAFLWKIICKWRQCKHHLEIWCFFIRGRSAQPEWRINGDTDTETCGWNRQFGEKQSTVADSFFVGWDRGNVLLWGRFPPACAWHRSQRRNLNNFSGKIENPEWCSKKHLKYLYFTGWWFGTCFYFSIYWGIIIPTDFFFHRGRYTTKQFTLKIIKF